MKKSKILIADDDRCIRRALRARLESWGYGVVEAEDGLGVIDRCLREKVSGLILDHGMPNGDGRTVARLIRNECDAPIVFLSGQDKEEFRAIVVELPDVYFLPKPPDHDKLFELLMAALPQDQPSGA